jgi:Leucine-rich repeat (LRR) protein
MIKNFTFLLFIFVSFILKAQNINIPDVNFKKALLNNAEINTDGNGEISESEAEVFTKKLSISNLSISDLTGIEHFTSISELHCEHNSLKKLDLSKNVKLEKLLCTYNKLTDITLDKNTNLIYISCSSNKLSKLSIDKLSKLESLSCAENNLETLDISKNTNLKFLSCFDNKISQIDLSNNILLEFFECSSNSLSNLDISSCTNLTQINCSQNNLQALDVSKNSNLFELKNYSNHITELDLRNNPKLTNLICYGNDMTSIHLHANCKLNNVNCFGNSLPFSELIKIQQAYPQLNYDSDNRILKKQENTEVIQVNWSHEVSIGKNKTKFNWFSVGDNKVTPNAIETISEGVFKIKKPGIFYCKMTNEGFPNVTLISNNITFKSNKAISFADVNLKNKLITNIDLNSNEDQEISEFEAAIYTKKLDISKGQIKNLTGIEYFTNINELNCSLNQLTSINISKNINLNSIDCRENKLTFSELSKIASYCSNIETYGQIVFDETILHLNDLINYSGELNIGDNETSYYWKIDGEDAIKKGVIEQTEKGIFKCKKRGKCKCYMTNETFPNTSIITNFVIIKGKDQTVTFTNPPASAKVNDKIELNASASSGLDVTFELVSGDATINGNTLTLNQAGKVEIKAVQTGNNEYEPAETSIAITVDVATGIENVLKNAIQIYPNPIVQELNIKFEKNENRMIYIYDLSGHLMFQKESYSNSEKLNISTYKRGMYILKIQSESETINHKILKQ